MAKTFEFYLESELTPLGMSDKKTIERALWYYRTYYKTNEDEGYKASLSESFDSEQLKEVIYNSVIDDKHALRVISAVNKFILGYKSSKGGVSSELISKAIDDTFNQVRYSHMHPETFPPIEHNNWREKWIKENFNLAAGVVSWDEAEVKFSEEIDDDTSMYDSFFQYSKWLKENYNLTKK